MHLMKTKTDSELEKQQKRPRAESRRRGAGRAVEKFQPAHIDAPVHAYAHHLPPPPPALATPTDVVRQPFQSVMMMRLIIKKVTEVR